MHVMGFLLQLLLLLVAAQSEASEQEQDGHPIVRAKKQCLLASQAFMSKAHGSQSKHSEVQCRWHTAPYIKGQLARHYLAQNPTIVFTYMLFTFTKASKQRTISRLIEEAIHQADGTNFPEKFIEMYILDVILGELEIVVPKESTKFWKKDPEHVRFTISMKRVCVHKYMVLVKLKLKLKLKRCKLTREQFEYLPNIPSLVEASSTFFSEMKRVFGIEVISGCGDCKELCKNLAEQDTVTWHCHAERGTISLEGSGFKIGEDFYAKTLFVIGDVVYDHQIRPQYKVNFGGRYVMYPLPTELYGFSTIKGTYDALEGLEEYIEAFEDEVN